ncbi:hypothetical protein K504DRAFT_454494 [Pleomassaria siparia CBS 279.74]|uniref:Uncharacterized protein n=1 Tax=Pleomassaria siparia CBS 279.74 TaxID=1314801 RepID=A0A6G1KBZ6_9PLEO|nr:hypothetical protein K504DRAFT_454494 [Pleomassaria siparia CBS 279.74]
MSKGASNCFPKTHSTSTSSSHAQRSPPTQNVVPCLPTSSLYPTTTPTKTTTANTNTNTAHYPSSPPPPSPSPLSDSDDDDEGAMCIAAWGTRASSAGGADYPIDLREEVGDARRALGRWAESIARRVFYWVLDRAKWACGNKLMDCRP